MKTSSTFLFLTLSRSCGRPSSSWLGERVLGWGLISSRKRISLATCALTTCAEALIAVHIICISCNLSPWHTDMHMSSSTSSCAVSDITSTRIAHQVSKVCACHLGQDAQKHNSEPHTKPNRSIKQQLEKINDDAHRIEVHVLQSKMKV